MEKNKIIKIIACMVIILFAMSCADVDLYTTSNVYVDNETDKEYLVMLDYNYDYHYYYYHPLMANKLSIIPPLVSKQIIDTYLSHVKAKSNYDSGKVYAGAYHFKVWIYNRKDSTYATVTREEIEMYRRFGRIDCSETEQEEPMLIDNCYIIINDSLTSKMTKNTHLTDSIFKLKK